ncbi:hypothetical protein BKE38_13650 [Pseudoroseomonas deserti]|uniref:Uncharacterized protein n=1 Tax=Teichococcus deserti TaxID=1817963 RepID=A0A1V2H269_9PROT|nr:hypothetical protein [Pseudoroseomonas deserti]ONG53019.1 hypothetical protein BKE38_13650 [Pseudoroseomonas deserti]
MTSARLWSLGVFLVALGIAASVVGWDALLWIPRLALSWLTWLPAAVLDAWHASPTTFGVIAVGVLLMLAARFLRR